MGYPSQDASLSVEAQSWVSFILLAISKALMVLFTMFRSSFGSNWARMIRISLDPTVAATLDAITSRWSPFLKRMDGFRWSCTETIRWRLSIIAIGRQTFAHFRFARFTTRHSGFDTLLLLPVPLGPCGGIWFPSRQVDSVAVVPREALQRHDSVVYRLDLWKTKWTSCHMCEYFFTRANTIW